MHVDDPARLQDLQRTIGRKPALRAFYRAVYERFAACLERCPPGGAALELGSGGGFCQELLPDVIASDLIAYENVDRVVDARELPFDPGSLRAILLFDVFHHIPDVERFLSEAVRCLMPGGRVLMVEPHRGLLSMPILRWLHHEPHDARARAWSFPSRGPLSSANTALPWIVFRRDRERFERLFPELQVVRYEPHSPLCYWLAGGLKPWSLLPGWAFGTASRLDALLTRLYPDLGSFVDIELVRGPTPAPP